MAELEPWYRIAVPREEVRQGRSFNPDEFAIHLEQVIADRGTVDYRDPVKFFSRNVFTRALKEHVGMVLQRLSGVTQNAPPVLTLVTQFGGGKTHTLSALFHLAKAGKSAATYTGVRDLLDSAGLTECPKAKVAAFVGNAWDPRPGCETPWLDLADRLAGPAGVKALGPKAKTTAPGTDALAGLFEAAGGRILILCDEVLNFCNRHRDLADGFYSFLQNLTVAMTGTTHSAAVISLPRSQVEMTDWDLQWQEKITKVVRRVAKDLIANDEAEISEVVRRRLFEDLGPEKHRRQVAKIYADWCFERRAQLPPELTAVDSAATEAKARDFLRMRFEACFPFHPATLSVFQRKWQALPQYQQTRGTLAMLAQWISWAFAKQHQDQTVEPLLTLGSAPLQVPAFRGAVLGQLGESRLAAAIDSDIAGQMARSRALDADTKGPLKDVHRRVATAIFFESSGGQRDRLAHLPELRFDLGGPSVDTTSVDSAAFNVEAKAFFIRKVSNDGFRIHYQPTLKKVVNDRRASLDYEKEVRPLMERAVREQFESKSPVRIEPFPDDSTDIDNSPRLQIIVVGPDREWNATGATRDLIRGWTQKRGESPRDYPAALVWCVKKPGKELREKAEMVLAWRRVQKELQEGNLGNEVQAADIRSVKESVDDAEDGLSEEVLASYRYVVIADSGQTDGLYVIDLGSGHASGGDSLGERIIAALKSESRLNESVGASYLERNWPEAFRESGAWPLASLRKCFLDGSLTRLVDPDKVLRERIPDLAARGELGFATGQRPEGGFNRVWFKEAVPAEEIEFGYDSFVIRKDRAKALREKAAVAVAAPTQTTIPVEPAPSGFTLVSPETDASNGSSETPAAQKLLLRVKGPLPPELWNTFGRKIVPKLRSGENLQAWVELTTEISSDGVAALESDVRQLLTDLELNGKVVVEKENA